MDRPADLYDRGQEWEELAAFARSPAPGIRLAIVSGRRRQGKSFLLRRISAGVGGLYHQAQQLGRIQALERFAADVGAALGVPADALRFPDWETALRTALGLSPSSRETRSRRLPRPELLVLDEFPYLLEHSPELPSVLQALYDEAAQGGQGRGAVIICGSALSVMRDLLSGRRPLRGRAQLDLTIGPFDYRDAAGYWGVADPVVAFQLDAVLGGTPGYRPLIDAPVPKKASDLPEWFGRTILNPAHALFHETSYLLREDPRMTDKQLYNSVLSAVASGKHTLTEIGATVGRDHNRLRHPMTTLVDSGFLFRDVDVLNPKKPLFFIADPIVRFEELITNPCRALLEEREVELAWSQSASTYASNVLGPHFERICQRWTRKFSGDRWGADIGEVGAAVLHDPRGQTQHQIDVVAVERGRVRMGRAKRIVMLGEAKASNSVRTVSDLERLDRLRELLVRRGFNAEAAHVAVFGRSGFHRSLARAASQRDDVHLIDLEELYRAPN